MRFKNTLWIALVFAGLAIYLLYIYLPWEIEQGEKLQEESQLFSFLADDITGMAIEYPDWEIEIERIDNRRWKIMKPVESPANDTVVFNIAEYFPTMNILQVIDEDPSDLAAFGLLSPAMKVSIFLKNEEKVIILLGDDSARIESNYAIKNNEKRVILVSNVLKKALMRKIEGWVEN